MTRSSKRTLCAFRSSCRPHGTAARSCQPAVGEASCLRTVRATARTTASPYFDVCVLEARNIDLVGTAEGAIAKPRAGRCGNGIDCVRFRINLNELDPNRRRAKCKTYLLLRKLSPFTFRDCLKPIDNVTPLSPKRGAVPDRDLSSYALLQLSLAHSCAAFVGEPGK